MRTAIAPLGRVVSVSVSSVSSTRRVRNRHVGDCHGAFYDMMGALRHVADAERRAVGWLQPHTLLSMMKPKGRFRPGDTAFLRTLATALSGKGGLEGTYRRAVVAELADEALQWVATRSVDVGVDDSAGVVGCFAVLQPDGLAAQYVVARGSKKEVRGSLRALLIYKGVGSRQGAEPVWSLFGVERTWQLGTWRERGRRLPVLFSTSTVGRIQSTRRALRHSLHSAPISEEGFPPTHCAAPD